MDKQLLISADHGLNLTGAERILNPVGEHLCILFELQNRNLHVSRRPFELDENKMTDLQSLGIGTFKKFKKQTIFYFQKRNY